jgi:hypothetical protein
MARRKYVESRLKELSDDDNVVIVLYAYGFYVDDSMYGVNHDRNYHIKKDIKDNITNPDWFRAYYVKEEKQVINNKEYLVIKASLTQ